MTLPDLTDMSVWPDSELSALRTAVITEQERRSFVASASERADNMARRYLEAVGHTENSEWVQPTGAHDAYPEGWKVQHNTKTWESLTPANVWEPGVSGWREVVIEVPGEEPPAPADWVQPTGAHDAYNLGDRVTFEGQVYESAIDANTWSPAAYPAGWLLITP